MNVKGGKLNSIIVSSIVYTTIPYGIYQSKNTALCFHVVTSVSGLRQTDGKMKGFQVSSYTFIVLYTAMKYLRLNTIAEKVGDK